MYPGQDPRLGGYQSFAPNHGGFTNRHTGAVIHQGAPGTINRGPIARAPLDGRLGVPLTGAPLDGRFCAPLDGRLGAPLDGRLCAPLDGRLGAPLDGRLGGPLDSRLGAPLLGAYASGPQHQQISQNAPGFHNEYPVTTIEHEPVTRIETVPVTKQIQVPVTHMESKEVSETI